MLSHQRYRKTTDDGRVFILVLHPDGTLREWLEGEPEEESWPGTWEMTSEGFSRYLTTQIGPYKNRYQASLGKGGFMVAGGESREEPTGTVTRILRA